PFLWPFPLPHIICCSFEQAMRSSFSSSLEAAMKFNVFAIATIAFLMFALPAIAHHSFAMFDASKTVTLEGTVKEFHWTNPHSWIFLTVADPKGQPAEWAIEMGSPPGLVRQGWEPKTLTPGMKVKVLIRPLKDGKI